MAQGQNAPAQTTAEPRAAWRPSALQRDYRRVLDLAREDPQLILDTDGTGLVIESASDADFQRGLAAYVACVGRFLAISKANTARPVTEWANQTDFPFVAALDEDELKEFRHDLIGAMFDAAQHATLSPVTGNLHAWSATADIYGQPDVLAQMTAALGEDDFVEVFPPPEEEAAKGSE